MCFFQLLDSKLGHGGFSYRSIPSVSITVERLGTRHGDPLVAPVPGQHHDGVGYHAVYAGQCHDHRDYIVSVEVNQHYPLMCL